MSTYFKSITGDDINYCDCAQDAHKYDTRLDAEAAIIAIMLCSEVPLPAMEVRKSFGKFILRIQ